MNNSSTNPLRKFGIVYLALLVLIVFVISFFINNEPVDQTGGESVEPFTSAFILYEDKPYLVSSSSVSENAIKDDLAKFARTVYADTYGTDGKRTVSFRLDNEPVVSGDKLGFSGIFQEPKRKAAVELQFLNNDRYTISIKDSDTGQTIDDQLSSNSPINKFIGSLPIDGERYGISYEPPDNVLITAYFRDPAILEEGRSRIRQEVGEEVLNSLNILISYPTPGFLDE